MSEFGGRNPEIPRSQREPDVVVRMDEFAIGGRDEILASEGVATCMGVVFYDNNLHRGAIGHLPDYTRGGVSGYVERFVSETQSPIADLTVYVRGGAPSEVGAEFTEYADANRKELLDGIVAMGIDPEKIDAQFLDRIGADVSIRMDTKTGEFTSKVEDLFPDQDY